MHTIIWCYDVLLHRIEQVIIGLLLFAVLGFSTAEILVRNLELELFDVVPAQMATYYLAFHLGLFSAALACRGARHITIDAVGAFMPMKLKHAVRVGLFLVAAGTTLMLTKVAIDYVYVGTAADARVLADRAGVLWSERLWKAPIIAACALMSLHFLVESLREARAVPNAPMERESPDLDDQARSEEAA